jgi:hypothetical protein
MFWHRHDRKEREIDGTAYLRARLGKICWEGVVSKTGFPAAPQKWYFVRQPFSACFEKNIEAMQLGAEMRCG